VDYGDIKKFRNRVSGKMLTHQLVKRIGISNPKNKASDNHKQV